MHVLAPVLILFTALAALLYSVFQFAHARLLTADLMEIERLHAEGLLPAGADMACDFQSLSALLGDIAPAVYMRQEFWIHLYFAALRVVRATGRASRMVENELARLTAYQASHYRIARARMAAIRAQ